MSPDQEGTQDSELDEDQPGSRTANPDEGPTMTPGGAMPSGSEMSHWKTAMPNPDATDPDSMPSSATSAEEVESKQ